MSKVSAIRAVIEAHKGQFFSVDFVKKDGTMRTYKNAQRCHKKGHDGKSTTAHIDNYMTIVENEGSNYQHRTLNLETVTRIRVAGVEFNF